MKFSMPIGEGRNFAKDPAVVKFKGKYFLYFSGWAFIS